MFFAYVDIIFARTADMTSHYMYFCTQFEHALDVSRFTPTRERMVAFSSSVDKLHTVVSAQPRRVRVCWVTRVTLCAGFVLFQSRDWSSALYAAGGLCGCDATSADWARVHTACCARQLCSADGRFRSDCTARQGMGGGTGVQRSWDRERGNMICHLSGRLGCTIGPILLLCKFCNSQYISDDCRALPVLGGNLGRG